MKTLRVLTFLLLAHLMAGIASAQNGTFNTHMLSKYSNNAKVTALLDEYDKACNSANSKDVDDPKLEKEQIGKQYAAKLAAITGAGDADRLIYEARVVRESKNFQITRLNLPEPKTLLMGELKYLCDKELLQLQQQGLGNTDFTIKRKEIEQKLNDDVLKLIGEVKYEDWIAYKNASVERKFKKDFGFTDAQYEKYKEIENKTAIEIYKVEHSNLSTPEKQAQIKGIKDAKTAALKAALPAAQFNNWYEYWSKSEAKKNRQ